MSYRDSLRDPRWIQRRYQILKRDLLYCQKCQNSTFKEKSRSASFLKRIDFSQSMDLRKKPFGIIDVHTIHIQDDLNNTVHKVVAPIWQEVYYSLKLTSLKFCYNQIEDENNDPKSVITLIENLSNSEQNRNIFERDLHVHHRYYQEGKLPWEYPDDALETLCWKCHEKFHANNEVDWLNNGGNKIGSLIPCDRCHGAGYFPQYSHIQGGKCFKCWGDRYFQFMQ